MQLRVACESKSYLMVKTTDQYTGLLRSSLT